MRHGFASAGHPANALVVDRKQDIAVLRVPGLRAAALPLRDPSSGDSVAILGYPENGPFDARPGRIGVTADVLVNGSLREVTALSGLVRQGNSGGPAVNAAGEVESTIFAARVGARAGFGIPAAPVRRRSRPRARARSRPAAADRSVRQEVEHAERPPERRDDVDAGGELAGARDQLARELASHVGGVRARRAVTLLDVLGDDDPRRLVVHAHRELEGLDRPDADEQRDRDGPPSRSRIRSRNVRSNSICVIANCAPASILRAKRSSSASRSSAVGFTATPGKNDVGASIARPWKSVPSFSRVISSTSPIESTS